MSIFEIIGYRFGISVYRPTTSMQRGKNYTRHTYTGWAKKQDHFLKCITFLYIDIGRHSVYQNVQLFITGSVVALHCCKAHTKSIEKMGNSTTCKIVTSSVIRTVLRHFLKIALALAPPRVSPNPSPAVGVALVLA